MGRVEEEEEGGQEKEEEEGGDGGSCQAPLGHGEQTGQTWDKLCVGSGVGTAAARQDWKAVPR